MFPMVPERREPRGGLLALLLVIAPTVAALEVRPGSDGHFLTAWQTLTIPSREVATRLAAPLNGRIGWVNAPGPYVDGGKALRPKKGLSVLFFQELEITGTQPIVAELGVGADGDFAVWLDGREVGRFQRRQLALWDDRVVRLTLAPGQHTLAIETYRKATQGGNGWRLAARLRDGSGGVPPGLRFHLPAIDDAAALHADGHEVTAHVTPTSRGFSVDVKVAPRGATVVGEKLAGEVSLGSRAVGRWNTGPLEVALERDGQYSLGVTYGPRRFTRKLGFTRAWHELLAKTRASLATAKLAVAERDSLKWNLEELTRHVADNIPDTRWLDAELRRVAAWAETAAGGANPYDSLRGAFYRAYQSPYDGRLQAYSVHVPRRYEAATKDRWPLVIGLHGIGSGTHYTLRRVLGKDRDKEGGEPDGKPMIRGNMPELPDYGVLTATAYGYHNSAFWFYGEDDVMRVVEEMKKAYRVDDDRVYLTGLSLGGLGTYHVGHHFADQFAALGPLGGFSSVKIYQQIRKHPKTPWESVLVEQRDATTYAENGRHTPMKVVHGQFDAPNHAKAMTKRYEALGYKVELDIPPLPHDVWQYSYGDGALIRWMKRYTRPTWPSEVVFKTHSYRYTRAYWTRLGWIDDYTKPALYKLSVTGARVVFSALENVRGLTLDLSKPALPKSGPIALVLPGGVRLETSTRGPVHLRREKSEWALAQSAEPPAGWKRPGCSGPADDIMHEPHVFVVGTRDPAQTDTNRRLVGEDRTYLRHIDHDIAFPVADDAALTDAELASKNLVVYGNARSNAVLARALATGKVPLRFEDGALFVGKRRFAGADVGVVMIVPNPWNPARMLKIIAGVTERGTLLSRHLPRFVPDVMVYDDRVATRYGERILIDRPVRFGGFFGSDWSLPRGLAEPGDL